MKSLQVNAEMKWRVILSNTLKNVGRRFAKTAVATCAVALALGTGAPVHAMSWGLDLPFFNNGGTIATFDSHYNAGAMGTYLSEMKANHLTWTRVWVCTFLNGLTFDGSGNCTGISGQVISNVQNFAQQANNNGITVEFVFLTSGDINSHPNLLENSSNESALINKALVPLGKAIQGYTAQIDLCNESDYAVGTVGWGYLRNWMSACKSSLSSNGVNRWVTCSVGFYTALTAANYGGVGLDFYEYHMYNDQGWCPITNLGDGKPVELNEFGSASPSNGWNHQSLSFNTALLNNFAQNSLNAHYQNAAPWCYIDDGDYQMRGNAIMGDVSSWGSTINGSTGGTTGSTTGGTTGSTTGSTTGGTIANGTHTMAPACATGSRLDVPSAHFANGQTLQIWAANGASQQNWNFNGLGSGRYTMTTGGSYCLDSAGATTSGTAATIWACSSGNANQTWTAHAVSGGYYFSVQNSGLCLDVRGSGSANGTVVQTYTCNGVGGLSQTWAVN